MFLKALDFILQIPLILIGLILLIGVVVMGLVDRKEEGK